VAETSSSKNGSPRRGFKQGGNKGGPERNGLNSGIFITKQFRNGMPFGESIPIAGGKSLERPEKRMVYLKKNDASDSGLRSIRFLSSTAHEMLSFFENPGVLALRSGLVRVCKRDVGNARVFHLFLGTAKQKGGVGRGGRSIKE